MSELALWGLQIDFINKLSRFNLKHSRALSYYLSTDLFTWLPCPLSSGGQAKYVPNTRPSSELFHWKNNYNRLPSVYSRGCCYAWSRALLWNGATHHRRRFVYCLIAITRSPRDPRSKLSTTAPDDEDCASVRCLAPPLCMINVAAAERFDFVYEEGDDELHGNLGGQTV